MNPDHHPLVPAEPLCAGFVEYDDGAAIPIRRMLAGVGYPNASTDPHGVSRVIDGLRYDTHQAALVASVFELDDAWDLHQWGLFRGDHGRWFVVKMRTGYQEGAEIVQTIHPLPDGRVLGFARNLVTPELCLRFLLDWYCTGWIPRNDPFVRDWAEADLSAGDCQTVMAALARLSPPS
jgi:hypothetical protein